MTKADRIANQAHILMDADTDKEITRFHGEIPRSGEHIKLYDVEHGFVRIGPVRRVEWLVIPDGISVAVVRVDRRVGLWGKMQTLAAKLPSDPGGTL